MPNYELTTDIVNSLVAAIDRAGCAINKAESELNEAGNQIEAAFTGNDLWTGLTYGVETMAALTPSASNYKTAVRNPNALLSNLVAELMGRIQAIIPYCGLGSGVLTIEQLLSHFNEGGPIVIQAAGPGFRKAMEAINAVDLKRWNYTYPVTPARGFYLGRALLGVFGAGNVGIDQTKFRGVAYPQFWPTLYGGTPYTAIVTGTVYDPSTDTFLANKTFTTGVVANGSASYSTVGSLSPGGPTPAPAGSSLVSVQNITGVHAGSSLYVGGIGGSGVWE